MPDSNVIAAKSDDEIWKIIAEQLNSKEDNLNYAAQFSIKNHYVTLDIDIHPDSGDENGKPFSSFSAKLPDTTGFRFNIEKQGLKHRIGKLFGMQDVIIGNADFDKKFLIQTNDVAKVKELLSNAEVSAALLKEPVVDFAIREHKIGANREIVLHLDIEGGITEPARLKDIFVPFKIVLDYLD
jgi:hypothetical protein